MIHGVMNSTLDKKDIFYDPTRFEWLMANYSYANDKIESMERPIPNSTTLRTDE